MKSIGIDEDLTLCLDQELLIVTGTCKRTFAFPICALYADGQSLRVVVKIQICDTSSQRWRMDAAPCYRSGYATADYREELFDVCKPPLSPPFTRYPNIL